MKQYLDLLDHILVFGVKKEDRTGTGTTSTFGYQNRYNLQKGFPLVTTKKTPFKSVVSELLWFLEGSTDERRLAEIHFGKEAKDLIGKKTVWTANANAQGKALGYINTDTKKELGPVYGKQWRNLPTNPNVQYQNVYLGHGDYEAQEIDAPQEEITIDQIQILIDELKRNPDSRRHIVSAWTVNQLDEMALPPCHCLFQFYVANNKLSCLLYQRSADAFLGVPFNIASYSLLTMMIADQCGYEYGEFIHTFGDLHIYNNHQDQVHEQLMNNPHTLPTVTINKVKDINSYTMDDFTLNNYTSHDAIRAPMAV